MVRRRQEVAAAVCELAGPDIARIMDPQFGWPSLVEVNIAGQWRPVALFAAPVGLSKRNRDAVERRFQNPGSDRPMVTPAGHIPMFVALWDEDPLVEVARPTLVVATVAGRAENLTRFSLFPRLAQLQVAARDGWADSVTTNNEQLTYLWPRLLDVAAAAAAEGVLLPTGPVVSAVEAAGVLDGADLDTAMQRLRRVGQTIVREAKFTRQVLRAYRYECAICTLGLGLVEAAHIYPAAAVGSADIVSNGLALCRNHHGAFDRSLLWVHPSKLSVSIHPDVHQRAVHSAAAAAFVQSTQGVLIAPTKGIEPDEQMFLRRYDYMAEQYGWVV